MYSINAKIAGSMLLASCLLFGGHAFAADATPDQVYQAAQAGNYGEAQAMMGQILRDHPNSAKAHFVEAELLGKQGKLQQAQEELNAALRLDPNQNFAGPGAVEELRTLIASGHASQARGTLGGMPWGLVLGIAGLLIVISLVMRARRRASYSQDINGPYGYGAGRAGPPYAGPPGGPQGGYGQGGYGYPGGPAPGPATGGMGTGILGGLATGAAVGAGVVAGESLMNRVLHGGSGSGNPGNAVDADVSQNAAAPTSPEVNYDMGGKDFGVRDANSWDDDDPARRVASTDGDASWNSANPWDDDGSSGDGGGWDDGSNSGSDDWT
jgi:hypothetical protein